MLRGITCCPGRGLFEPADLAQDMSSWAITSDPSTYTTSISVLHIHLDVLYMPQCSVDRGGSCPLQNPCLSELGRDVCKPPAFRVQTIPSPPNYLGWSFRPQYVFTECWSLPNAGKGGARGYRDHAWRVRSVWSRPGASGLSPYSRGYISQ